MFPELFTEEPAVMPMPKSLHEITLDGSYHQGFIKSLINALFIDVKLLDSQQSFKELNEWKQVFLRLEWYEVLADLATLEEEHDVAIPVLIKAK